jgi:DNA-binding transcriptional ArsR family regulator
MPDEHDFKKYKSIEEYSQTLEGNKYFHGLYLKAVNHPVRREMLKIINKHGKISREKLLKGLLDREIVSKESAFNYNLNYLLKALCVKSEEEQGKIFYQITQEGKVVEYLE